MTKEWPAYREIIIKLYKQEGKSLESVREIMIDKHDFRAAIRTYRNWLRKWGVWKYTRDPSKVRTPSQQHTAGSISNQRLSAGGLPTPPMRPIDHPQQSPGTGYSPFGSNRSRDTVGMFDNQSHNAMQTTLSQPSSIISLGGSPYPGMPLQQQSGNPYTQGLYSRQPPQTSQLAQTPPQQTLPLASCGHAHNFSPASTGPMSIPTSAHTSMPPQTLPLPSSDTFPPSSSASEVQCSAFFSSPNTIAGDLAIPKRSNLPFGIQSGIQTPGLSPYRRSVHLQESPVHMPDNFFAQGQRQSRNAKCLPRRQHSAHSWTATSVDSMGLLTMSMDPPFGEQGFGTMQEMSLSPPLLFDPWSYRGDEGDRCNQRAK